MGGVSYFHGYIGGDLMLLLGISMLGITMLV
jgi:hypothetical protein